MDEEKLLRINNWTDLHGRRPQLDSTSYEECWLATSILDYQIAVSTGDPRD
jgi:hypothetical protein